MHWNRQGLQKKRNKRKILRVCRIFVQAVFFILAPALFSQAFSGVKSSMELIGNGSPLALTSFVKSFLALAILTVCFGRIFCGWACAFGALGDWVYLAAQAIFKRWGIRIRRIPAAWVIRLQKLKYCVLILILVLCFWGSGDRVTAYSPWIVFSLLTAGNWNPGAYPVAMMLFVFILLGMAVQERFFCQFLCPMGALFSLLPELPLFALKRKSESCVTGCSACKQNCPAALKLSEEPEREGECFRCGQCAAVCPRGNIRVVPLESGRNEQKEQAT